MPTGDAESVDVSPPTQRVVSVLELLAAADEPQTSAQIADCLDLSRSTVGNVLSALRSREWVNRRSDLRYELGPAFLRAAEREKGKLAGGDPLRDALEDLAQRVECGVALIRLDGAEIRFIAVVENRGRIPAGISVGTRLPLLPPGAATIVAHSAGAVQQGWLAASEPDLRPGFEQLIADILDVGVAVFGVDAHSVATLDVLADVVEHLSDDPASRAVRERVVSLLSGISGRAYRPAELAEDRSLPISYLSAPVLGPDGAPLAEVLIGPLRAAVPRADRERYGSAVVATAARISRLL